MKYRLLICLTLGTAEDDDGDDDDGPMKKRVKELGTVVVTLQHVDCVGPKHESKNTVGFQPAGRLSEKALKGQALSHTVA